MLPTTLVATTLLELPVLMVGRPCPLNIFSSLISDFVEMSRE